MDAAEYLRTIGARGGAKTSKVKRDAVRKNLEKARKALAKKRNGPRKGRK